MKSIPAAALLTLALATPAFAALPPHYQRQAEFEAVLTAAVEALGISSPVESIRLVKPDTFEVQGGGCSVSASIVDVPNKNGEGFVGPRQFSVVLGEVSCK